MEQVAAQGPENADADDGPRTPAGTGGPVGGTPAANPSAVAGTGPPGVRAEDREREETPAESRSEPASPGSSRSTEEIERLLDDVDSALVRLDEGTYGLCTSCAEPIDDARLAAAPAVSRCGACSAAVCER